MISFFSSDNELFLAVRFDKELTHNSIEALKWLFSGADILSATEIEGTFIGPRKEMITPWSTAAVEITENMNIEGITRIEEFYRVSEGYKEDSAIDYDKMLQRVYHRLDENVFTVNNTPEPVREITDFKAYNIEEGLALSQPEIEYLENLSKKLGRPLTDSEVFGFSQVNSEHCRHKIFNGTFIIDGKEMDSTLFKLIKKTSAENPGRIVSAYKDNCAFIEGPKVSLFTLPSRQNRADSD